MNKIKKFFKKLNPINVIENFFIKKFAKKVIKSLPDLRKKGLEVIEKNTEELLNKIQIAIVQFIENHTN